MKNEHILQCNHRFLSKVVKAVLAKLPVCISSPILSITSGNGTHALFILLALYFLHKLQHVLSEQFWFLKGCKVTASGHVGVRAKISEP